MHNDFPPSSLVPDWVRPAPSKEPSFFLQQSAYFSLYAPFVMLLIGAIAAFAFPPSWRLNLHLVVSIVALTVFAIGLILGSVAFIGGIKRRWIKVYAYAFWGCLFNGVFLILKIGYMLSGV
jgi:hypothetical protein